MKIEEKDLKYEDLILELFKVLIYFFGVDKAIILIYKINSCRGIKL